LLIDSSYRNEFSSIGLLWLPECIDYMTGGGRPHRPSERFHALPQVGHGLGVIR